MVDRAAADAGQTVAEQLGLALREARLQLDDLQEERRFTLGQTGVHLGGRRVAQLHRQWDAEERALRERIAAIEQRLAAIATPN